jgi:hypothetical protein
MSAPIIVFSILLGWLPNFLADLALLYRMLAAYPPSITPRRRMLLILVAPVLLKLVRVLSVIMFLFLITRTLGDFFEAWNSQEQAWIVIERACAALDNGCVPSSMPFMSLMHASRYATMFFLWKIRTTFLSSRNVGWVAGTEPSRENANLRRLDH